MMLVAWLMAEAAAAGASPPITVQQQFEQASDALGAGKSEEAVVGFRALAAWPGISARTRSIALLREGTALVGLGRSEEARQTYVEGLTLASKTDPALKDDRRIALIALGGIYKGDYDYAAARRVFVDARALSDTPVAQLQALLAFVSVSVFDDNDAAYAAIDEALKIAATTKVDKGVDATIHDWRGRVLLNRGDQKGALAEFQIALKDQGGLTEKTDLRDVMVRSDVALAYLVAKNADRASEYFEMTGEGRLPDGPFATAARMDLPHCGDDIQPDDDAVVEFGIGEDGSVSYADPIYASRRGPVAVRFARAVSNWSWRPSEVAKIPFFYRAVTRVELRCSQAGARPADLSLLLPDAAAWLTAHGSNADVDVLTKGAPPVALREQIGAAEKSGDKPILLVGWLMALAAEPATDFDERQHLYERAGALARAESAPPAVTAYLDLSAAELKSWRSLNNKTQYHEAVRKELARPELAADVRTASVLRLVLASPLRGGGYEPDTEALLRHVIDDKAIGEHDPLKVGALVRLASFQAQAGRIDDARAAYLKTGLDAQQCSLVDAQPAMLKTGVQSNDYPIDLVRMHVSGWTRIEFDILPSGETANRRAVLSYPPFMFGDATVKAMAKTRYTQTYRPQGELGCGGASTQFRYQVPNR